MWTYRRRCYSMDRNIWHLSHEGADLEEPWNEPPEDLNLICKNIEDTPSSISLFAWKYEDEVLFYFAIEARDSACNKEDFERHNQVLDLGLSDERLYYFIEKNNGEYFRPDLSRNELQQMVIDGGIKKVRVQSDVLKPYLK